MPATAGRVAQAELALTNTVSQLDTCDRHGRCRHGLEAVRGRASSLDGTVVLLDDVEQIAVGATLDVTPEQGFVAQQPQRPATGDVSIER